MYICQMFQKLFRQGRHTDVVILYTYLPYRSYYVHHMTNLLVEGWMFQSC